MAFSAVSGGIVTITTDPETMATAFAATFNAAVGDAGTYIDRLSVAGADANGNNFCYKVKSLAFVINSGSFTIAEDWVEFDQNGVFPCIQVNSGATFTLGTQWTYSSLTLSHSHASLFFAKPSAAVGVTDTEAGVYVNGGTFNMYGGTITANCSITFIAGSTVSLNSATIILKGRTNGQTVGTQTHIRQRTTGLTINGLTLIGERSTGLDASKFGSFIAAPASATGYAPIQMNGGIVGSGTAGSNLYFLFKGFAGQGNVEDVSLWGPATANSCHLWDMVNPVAGNSLVVGTSGLINNTPGTSQQNTGIAKIAQEINVQVKNKAGTAIANPNFYSVDRNNSARISNSLNFGDYTVDMINAVIGTAGGLSGVLNFYTGIVSVPNSSTGTLKPVDDRTPFVMRTRLFSYLMYEQAVNPSAPSTLPVTLLPDTGITLSQSAALATTGITLTDHGGSPVTWNSKLWGLTITGDLSVNSGLTAALIYQYIHASITRLVQNATNTDGSTAVSNAVITTSGLTASALVGNVVLFTSGPNRGVWASVTANTTTTITTDRTGWFPGTAQTYVCFSKFFGRLPLDWHDMLVLDTSTVYETQRGTYGGTLAYKGVRVIDQSGNPFPGFIQFQADDGTYYTPPVSVTFSLSNLQAGSVITIFQTSGMTVLASTTSSGTSFNYSYSWTSDIPITVAICSLGFLDIYTTAYTLTSSNQTIPISQVIDRTFNNP